MYLQYQFFLYPINPVLFNEVPLLIQANQELWSEEDQQPKAGETYRRAQSSGIRTHGNQRVFSRFCWFFIYPLLCLFGFARIHRSVHQRLEVCLRRSSFVTQTLFLKVSFQLQADSRSRLDRHCYAPSGHRDSLHIC